MPSFSNWRVLFFAILITALFACSTLYIAHKIDQATKEIVESVEYKLDKAGK